MANDISVGYSVLAEGLSLSVTEEGPQATARYKVLWEDMPAFVQEMKGTSRRAGNSIVRTPPFPFPPYPSIFAVAIESIEPHGRGLPWFGLMARKYAICTVRFAPLKFDFDGAGNGQSYTSISFGVGGEFLTFPNTTYRFPDGSPTNTPIGRVVAQIDISVTRHMMPYLPVYEMADLAGKVNAANYTIGNYAFSPGTLLFPGGDTQIQADSTGRETNEVSYKFMFRAVPWNYFMSPARSGAYQGFQPVTDSSGAGVYEEGDFATLP